MFVLYTEKNALDDILFYEEEKYPNWKKILTKNIDICVNISDDDLEKELADSESPLFFFLNAHAGAKQPIALANYFPTLIEEPSEVLNHPRSAFILDISEDEALQAQKEFGMAVFSSENIDDTFFKGGFFKELNKNNKVDGGWQALIDFELPFSNALVISDEYLFQNDEKGNNLGLSNLPNMLDAFLPKYLGVVFHLTIIAADAGKSKDWWAKRFGSLKAEIIRLRDYNINIELVLAKTIHKRRAISNYLNSWTDKGFSVFKDYDKNKVRDDNDIHIYRIFNNLEDFGDSHYSSSQKGLDELKKICSSVSDFVNSGNTASNRMIFGDCNADKTIKNRLLE